MRRSINNECLCVEDRQETANEPGAFVLVESETVRVNHAGLMDSKEPNSVKVLHEPLPNCSSIDLMLSPAGTYAIEGAHRDAYCTQDTFSTSLRVNLSREMGREGRR